MAETLLSPGVLARENDQSAITQGPREFGAAIIGPSVKGPVEIPTLVTSYSDYTSIFGSTVESGSNVYSYLTSIAANNYFQNGGNSLLVTRVTSGSFTSAATTTVYNNVETGALTLASIGPGTGGTYTAASTTSDVPLTGSENGTGAEATVVVIEDPENEGSFIVESVTVTSAGSGYVVGEDITFSATLVGGTGTQDVTTLVAGDIVNDQAFVLETISEGEIMNSAGSESTSGALANGTADNLRWEITSVNAALGTFSLLVRRGNDTTNEKSILESYNNLSLDPYASNYIAKAIGDTVRSVDTEGTDTYIKEEGAYPNVSRYVRVKAVNYPTPNYLDNDGDAVAGYADMLPLVGSGAFSGATGSNIPASGVANFYSAISANTQGLEGDDYDTAIALMSNKDDYQFNVLSTPGLLNSEHASQITSVVNVCLDRGDAIAVLDLVGYGVGVGTVKSAASGFDNSYASTYWPWLQTVDPNTGQLVYVPASTMIPGVYAYTDASSEPWFAPAGITRGGLGQVVRAERKLTAGNRDELYEANVNPIATFPSQGVVVFGQKTLQKKSTALDRVNVRRLLIALKSYISQVSNNLVFEQNSIATRNNFLTQVNPYLESVQQRQGLYAFKVVMDDTNNTADVIDRNELVGQIYLQPTKTAEFIVLDFNVLPTGAVFPA